MTMCAGPRCLDQDPLMLLASRRRRWQSCLEFRFASCSAGLLPAGPSRPGREVADLSSTVPTW